MDASGSVLQTVVSRAKRLVDEPDIAGRWSDRDTVNHLLGPALSSFWQRMNMNRQDYVIMKHRFATVANQEHYTLPPNVGAILRFFVADEDYRLIGEQVSRSLYNPFGPGWKVDGSDLWIKPAPTAVQNIELWYVPTGNFLPHYASGESSGVSGTLSEDADGVLNTLTLAASTTLGNLDKRPSGLAGLTLRILKTSDNQKSAIEERIIESHTVAADGTATVKVRRPFLLYADSDEVGYEVGLPGNELIVDALAAQVALRWAIPRRMSESDKASLYMLAKEAMKAYRDTISNINPNNGPRFEKDTIFNENIYEPRP